MNEYRPPYTISDIILKFCVEISEIVTQISISNRYLINPRLRRENRLKTIQASLAIENNTLSLLQVTDIIDGKRVLGPPSEIREVKNAFEAYENILKLNPYEITDILKTHKILMKELTNEDGRFRSGGVGIFAADRLVHMAPPAELVPELMANLVKWVKEDDAHPLIKSCVFHYEFEFIHPFADGNGRMGRIWQTLLLTKWNLIFGYLPIESLIKDHQDEYYKVLSECDKKADCTDFIEYMLKTIRDSLQQVLTTEQVTEQATEQVQLLVNIIGNETLSTKEIMQKLILKHRPNFRNIYLLPALKSGLVEMTIPDKPNSSKQKYRRSL